MNIYAKSTSTHPLQLKFNNFGLVKRLALQVGLIFFGAAGLFISVLAFFPTMNAIAQLYNETPVVNVNYVGMICGAGLFLSPIFLFAAYTTIVHRRVVVMEELTRQARRLIHFLFGLTLVFMMPVPLIIAASSFILIHMQDYTWCPQMSAGSGWDSYWVVDPSYCTSAR